MYSNEQVIVSVIVPVYNHEKYIAQTLDSILMQKTKYRYEVWIGEDASTDDTRAVLMEYEKKCPPDFHFLYREKNMHNSECRNDLDLRLRCKGKYLICLEGDDFWTDENKIEKQIDFLESHPEYIAVSHNCVVVGKDFREFIGHADLRDGIRKYQFSYVFKPLEECCVDPGKATILNI